MTRRTALALAALTGLAAVALPGCGGDSNTDLVRRSSQRVSAALQQVTDQLEGARTRTGAYPPAAEVLASTDLPDGVQVTVYDSSPTAYCLYGKTTSYPRLDLVVVERQHPFTTTCSSMRSGNQTPEQAAQQQAARDAENASG